MPQTSPRHLRPQAIYRKGFTTIELLVVIGIIGLIAGIMVVGLPYAAAGLKKNQTETRLGQIVNAFTEVKNNKTADTRLFTVILPGIYFNDNTGRPALPASSAQNASWVAVPASASESLYRTGKVYQQLKSNPQFAAILNDLPSDKKKKINFTVATKTVTTAAANGTTIVELEFPLDAWDNPILFVFDNLQSSFGVNDNRPLVIDIGGTQTPTGGLTYLYSKSAKQYWKPASTPLTPAPTTYGLNTNVSTTLDETTVWTKWLTDAGLTQPTDAARDVQTGNVQTALRAPDRMPFFVSAGPDGKFETHDDNVYSFTN